MSADLIDSPEQLSAERSPASASVETIRVLHVINGEHYSGAERMQDLLGQRLGEFGFEVGFACLKKGKFTALRQANACELLDVPMRSRFDLRPVAALLKIIKKHNYQILHTHTARSAFVGRIAAMLAGVPHVHHVHSPTSLDTTRWFANRVNMLIEKLSLRKADGVIAVSHSLGGYVKEQGLGDGVLAVIPNGVPVQGTLTQRETPHGTWTLGAVALFRPRKGLEVLLESLAKLRAQGLPVRLRAVGAFETESYEIQIKSLADKLGLTNAIDWTGFTANVPAEFAKMDLFVLPSLFGEGLPMVVLEAMAAGVPVVATRVEGVPEAIRDCLDGLIAEPSNADHLAACLADVIEARIDWHALRSAAHTRQAERFSDRSMALGVANVYRRVLEDKELRGRGWTEGKPRQMGPHSPDQRETPEAEGNEEGLAAADEIHLLGTRIDNLNMAEAVDTLVARLDGDQLTQVCFVNADCLNITYHDAAYREMLAQSDLVFADGVGLKIAGRILGQPVRDNVNGTDLFPQLCMALAKRRSENRRGLDHFAESSQQNVPVPLSADESRIAANSGKGIFLLGGKPGVADQVGRWITTHFPGLEVCGTRDGYFQPHEEPHVIREIANSGADLLLVAFGAPRQDMWVAEHLPETNCKVAMGVGGLFDFYSGRIPRAPYWMRKSGLEWFYRLCQEPRRLAKRYLVGNPLFLYRVACERFGHKREMVESGRVANLSLA